MFLCFFVLPNFAFFSLLHLSCGRLDRNADYCKTNDLYKTTSSAVLFGPFFIFYLPFNPKVTALPSMEFLHLQSSFWGSCYCFNRHNWRKQPTRQLYLGSFLSSTLLSFPLRVEFSLGILCSIESAHKSSSTPFNFSRTCPICVRWCIYVYLIMLSSDLLTWRSRREATVEHLPPRSNIHSPAAGEEEAPR